MSLMHTIIFLRFILKEHLSIYYFLFLLNCKECTKLLAMPSRLFHCATNFLATNVTKISIKYTLLIPVF